MVPVWFLGKTTNNNSLLLIKKKEKSFLQFWVFNKEGIEAQGEENVTYSKQFVAWSKKDCLDLPVNDKNRMNQDNFQNSGF